MKRKKKILLLIGIVITTLTITLVSTLKNPLVKAIVAKRISKMTGVPVTIDKLSIQLYSRNIKIEGLKIHNPPGKYGDIFLDIPMINAVYDLSDLLKMELHLYEADIVINEMAIAKDKDGVFNFDILLSNINGGATSIDFNSLNKELNLMPLNIDKLKLSVGKAVYSDYSVGDVPVTTVYEIGLKEKVIENIGTYKEVDNENMLKTLMSKSLTKLLKTPVTINGFSLEIFEHILQLEGVQLYNPPEYQEYPEGVFVNIHRMSMHYDPSALLDKKLHMYQFFLDLDELVVVKGTDGRLNVEVMMNAIDDRTKAINDKLTNEQSKQISVQIDALLLNIGKVIYKDFSKEGEPVVKAYDIEIKEKLFKNISGKKKVIALILTQALKPTAIKTTAIAGLAGLTGVVALPVGAAILFTGEDSSKSEFDASFDVAFRISLETLEMLGEVVGSDSTKGFISGKVNGHKVTIKIKEKQNADVDKKIDIIVSARKLLVPKSEVASGILYQISEQLQL